MDTDKTKIKKKKKTRNMEDGRVKYRSHEAMVKATNKRRNKRYKDDPEYRAKVKAAARERYRKTEGVLVSATVAFNSVIPSMGKERDILFSKHKHSCAGLKRLTFTFKEVGEIFRVSDQTLTRWVKLGMIPAPWALAEDVVEVTKHRKATNEDIVETRAYSTNVYLLKEVQAIANNLRSHEKMRFSVADKELIKNIKRDMSKVRWNK